ncbi:GABA transporter 1, partial [Mucuna pruriens]
MGLTSSNFVDNGKPLLLIEAFGFMPLDFILLEVFFNVTFKPSKQSPIFFYAFAFSALGAISVVAAIMQIVLDAKT